MGQIKLRGKTYWIRYYRMGKRYEESVDKALGRRASHADARALLRKREGAIADGRFFGLASEKTEFGGFREVRIPSDPHDYDRDGKRYIVYGMVKELIDDYRMNKRKSLARVFRSCWDLSRHFEGFRLARIGTDQIKEYKVERAKKGMANATINRDLAALKRIFRLAHTSTPPKVNFVPKIEKLEEKNVRRGFCERSEYLAIRNELQDYLKPVAECAYVYGGRRSEVLSIEWPMVDMVIGKIDLGETKNGDPRIWYLTPWLYQVLLDMKMRRDQQFPDQKKVFVRPDGQPIIEFKEGWTAACRRAGYEGRLFHDLRRTAVRNMIRSKLDRKTAMLISGHRTEAVFERYNIVDETDLSDATIRMEKYYRDLDVKIAEHIEKGTISGTIKEVGERERKE